MTPGTKDYTTPDGNYRYGYIPEELDLTEYTDLLNEAPKYTKVCSAFIHNDYVAHLQKELQMVPSADNQMKFFINLQEGHCQFLSEKVPDYKTIILWVDKGTAEHTLWKILKKGNHIQRKGLQYILDYNCGGALTKERVNMANLIVFG